MSGLTRRSRWLLGVCAPLGLALALAAVAGADELPVDEAESSTAPAETGFAEVAESPVDWLPPCGDLEHCHHLGGKARGYFVTDQRFEFTGQETTFAAEGVIDGGYHRFHSGWELLAEGELFVNLPFDRNLLLDTPERRSFAANFDVEPLEISQLYLGARRDDWYVAIGRFVTPFGRFYFPQYRNDFSDAPFIRSEAILFRETGALAQWDPEGFVFTAALTNGGYGQDTNATKALVARAGIDREHFALGASVKWHDGISSEGQKQYQRHLGIDAMVRRGRWTLSGEAIYDQYGFRRPGFDPNNIFWERSIYFRDLNDGLFNPIEGLGYYVDLGYGGDCFSCHFNFGSYFPELIGDVRHDQDNHRGLVKLSWHAVENFELYGIVLAESDAPLNIAGREFRRGVAAVLGCQFSL